MKKPGNLQIAIILIVVGMIGLFLLSYRSPSYYTRQATAFQSNGERIYFTATTDSGEAIISSIGTMTMRGGMMSCAACHGPDGTGGRGRMMMWTFDAPDIRYSSLAGENYTDDLIKRAITKGIDEDGEPLDTPMPVWHMSDSDLNDLIGYLKSLK
ncbi:MAG: cytochrome c [Candidatus Methanoperedens sp.]|nr:cytochrome c [Candidatus Methanoperedens sp.]MCZ7371983.1 cytochrome c [Candidatus Methanoperedens sp.]